MLESELFGHERGAFTGAVTQNIGRFQLAEGGTLFLDEIGELPLDLQPKLLRVLQEMQFERLGGARAIQVNARVIAATNQDLWRLMQERKFRADLYYRLNVFPITLPPLRDRVEDIPALVEYFVRRFSREMGRIDTIPSEVMDVLKLYDWPGNIRELDNFIKRAVIMTMGTALRPALGELKPLPLGLASLSGASRCVRTRAIDGLIATIRKSAPLRCKTAATRELLLTGAPPLLLSSVG